MVYMNTNVTRGSGEFVVTATGMATEVGHISGMLQAEQAAKTPLTLQLDKLTWPCPPPSWWSPRYASWPGGITLGRVTTLRDRSNRIWSPATTSGEPEPARSQL